MLFEDAAVRISVPLPVLMNFVYEEAILSAYVSVTPSATLATSTVESDGSGPTDA